MDRKHRIFKAFSLFAIAFAIQTFSLQAGRAQDLATNEGELYEWTGPVMDWSGILTAQDRSDFEGFLNKLHDEQGIQIAVMTVPTMNGDSEFSTKHLQEWRKDREDLDNGMLLVVATEDRRLSVAKGKNTVGKLTKDAVNQVFDEDLIPLYLEGREAEGIRKAVLKFAVILTGDGSLSMRQTAKPSAKSYRKDKEGLYEWTGSFVLDAADILTAGQYGELAEYLLDLNDTTGVQIAVLTVPTTDGEPVHDFAVRHFDKWKLGQKDIDNGALLTIVMDSHDLDITTGDGTEGVLTDLLCKRIIDEVLVPAFRGGTQGRGVISAVHNMAGIITQDDSLVTVSRSAGGEAEEDAKWYEVLGGLAIFLLIVYFVGKAIIGRIKDILEVVGIIKPTYTGGGSSYSGSSYSSDSYSSRSSYSSSSYRSSSSHSSSSHRSGGGGRTSGGGASGKW